MSESLRKMKVAVLVSGRGSNMKMLFELHAQGKLPCVEFVGVISNNPGAVALDVAKDFGFPAVALDHRPFKKNREAHEEAVIKQLREFGADFVVLAGYMRILTPRLLTAFPNKMINIHPALLPSFPGVNGQKQAWDYGVRYAGCSVHFVNEETDGGPIILQRQVPVLQTDNASRLSARILAEEHKALPLALDLWSRGRLVLDGRRVVICKGQGSFSEWESDLNCIDPILVATGNMHKVGEIAEILKDIPLRLLSTKSFPCDDEPVEDGADYLENARIKAKFWQEKTGLWALADDSGLEVDAMEGRPGLLSSRYAETAELGNEKMLGELKEVPDEKRTARFVCTVVLCGPNGEEFSASGACEGKIGFASAGEGGFGYDPIFVPDGFNGKHLAELTEQTKNTISHRSSALSGLSDKLKELFA
jgi:phosphoribosylglycinamide formyltransferase 1